MEAEEAADDGQILHRQRRGLIGGLPQHHLGEGSLAEEQYHPDGCAIDPLDDKAVPNALPDTVVAAGTLVLAHKGRHAHANGFHRQGEHLANLIARRLACNGGSAQRVDGALQQNSADGRHRVLKPHRQTDPAERGGMAAGESAQPGTALQQISFAGQPVQVQQSADKLADHGGKGSTNHTQREYGQQQIVQHDI